MIEELVGAYGQVNSEALFHLTATGRAKDEVRALEYLKEYFMSDEKYFQVWKPIQKAIFQNEDKGLPSMMFRQEFTLFAKTGGVLFERNEFESFQKCIIELGDRELVIVQNDFGRESKVSPLRMIYPTKIKWDELMNGNFISTAIFELLNNDYFVFSESGCWGKYSSNEYDYPIDIIGCKPEFASIFKRHSDQYEFEMDNLLNWLPPAYKKILRE